MVLIKLFLRLKYLLKVFRGQLIIETRKGRKFSLLESVSDSWTTFDFYA